jgi:hypothetical protein
LPSPHASYRYRIHGLTIAGDVLLPELPRARGSSPAMEVTRGAGNDPCEWFHRWREGRRTWLTMGRTAGGYRLRFPGLAEFAVSRDGRRIQYEPAPNVPPATVRHLVLNQVIPLAFARAGRNVLHASAVHVPRFGAIAFAGRSGSGKSTLAAALSTLGCRIVTDDALVLGPEGKRDLLEPAYPELRLWRESARALRATGDLRGRVAHYSPKARLGPGVVSFHRRPSTLRAVFMLAPRHSDESPIRASPLPAATRLVALMRTAYVLDVDDRDELTSLFAGLSELVGQVAVRRLAARDDRRGLQQIAAAVLDEARRIGRDA